VADGGGERRGDPAALRAGYERLRAAVLSGRPDGFRLGHGVLAARGMVAWMATLAALETPAARPGTPARPAGSPPAASPPPPADGLVSLPGADQVVAVLAQMALAHAA
jgi:hypothetical protein